ncbi:MAG: porin [Rhodospirillaceae bacterium]
MAMKRFLLAACGTAALLAGPGRAAAETAANGFSVRISGDASFSVLAIKQSYDSANGNTSNTDFTNLTHLLITPSATADNGTEYGANLRINAWVSDGTIEADQAYLFADGGWGRIEAGLVPNPNSQYGVTAPSGFGTGGVIGDWAEGSGINTSVNNQTTFLEAVFGGGYNNITKSSWATRITYITPRILTQADEFTGLMGYLSYAPQNVSVNTDVSRTYRLTTAAASAAARNDFCSQQGASPAVGCYYKNIAEAGFRYDGVFDGISVIAGAAYERGEAPTSNGANPGGYHPLSAYQAGLQLGYAGLLIGGSYLNAGKSAYSRSPALILEDQSTITAGVSYETGPVVIGFNYAHGQDAGDPGVAGKRTADLFSVGLTYSIAPGFITAIEYLRSLSHNEAGFANDAFGNDAQGTAAVTGFGSGNASMIVWKTTITF